MKLVILEYNCNGEGRAFETYVREHHPEIEIDFRERTGGIRGGLYEDGEWFETGNDLWEEYCNA